MTDPFVREPKPKPASGPQPAVTKNTPIEDRAGTRLDHRFTRLVSGVRENNKRIDFGTIDTRQRIYQHGGDLSKLVYWKLKVAAFGPEEWRVIKVEADFIELIDHNTNKCYRISVADAKEKGYVYEGKVGRRWGVPLDLFTVYDKNWAVLVPASA